MSFEASSWGSGRLEPIPLEFVLVEALDFKLERASQHPVHIFMNGVGYELVAKTLNTLFYREAK